MNMAVIYHQQLEVNEMLPNPITKITNSLLPPGFKKVSNIRHMQNRMGALIDMLGEQSAKEQGLPKVITTASKLLAADNHVLYILKDAEANNGKGEAVGFLKVGHKHLYLHDESQRVREVEPLCVLDFFVKQDRQRRGHGKALFDHMLKDMNTPFHALAIDGPSEKMCQFVRRHFGVTQLMRQSNNFAVPPQFFEVAQTSSRASRPAAAPPGPVGRFAAVQPKSNIGSVIHGDGEEGDCKQSPEWDTSPAPAPVPASAASAAATPAAAASAAATPAAAASAAATPAAAASAAATPAAAAPAAPARAGARPSSLPVTAAPPSDPRPADRCSPTPAGAPSATEGQLTDQGYFDVKFYHQKLW